VAIWIHAETLGDLDEFRVLRFYFGTQGWCEVRLG